MTEIQERIVDLVRTRGRITLEGNREFWTILEVAGGKFFLAGGDSMTGAEEYRKEIDPAEVLERVSRHCRERAGLFGGPQLVGDEQVLRYLAEHPHL